MEILGLGFGITKANSSSIGSYLRIVSIAPQWLGMFLMLMQILKV